jgi:hypothetical protein
MQASLSLSLSHTLWLSHQEARGAAAAVLAATEASLRQSMHDLAAAQAQQSHVAARYEDMQVRPREVFPYRRFRTGGKGRGRARIQVHCIRGPCHPPQVGVVWFYC